MRIDAADLSACLSALARRYQVPGAQLAVHHHGVTTAVQVGEQRYGTGEPVTRDAAFPIGSISKTFTATLTMILVADGDLELDAPLGDYLPELDSSVQQRTLRQILSHTSGFASDAVGDEPTGSIRRYVLEHCRPRNVMMAPGVGFSYSNIGYVLAGHLIEAITGMSWWGAMESVLLAPLGIDPAFIVGSGLGSGGCGAGARPVATGHSVQLAAGRTRPVDQSLTEARAPAGALAVSAVDLVALGMTQLPARADMLLPTGYADQMRRAVPSAEPFGLADGWGLGLARFGSDGPVWVGHDGNADGTACAVRINPQSGCVIAFTSNATTGLALWQDLVPELATRGLPIKNYSNADALGCPVPPPAECPGTYLNGDSEYTVAERDGGFFLLVDSDPVARLSFHDDLFFSQQDLDSGEYGHAGRFLRNPLSGRIDQIQVDGRLARRRADPADEDGRCSSLTGVSSP